MVLMAGLELPVAAIRRMIGGAIELIVQQDRLADGRRVITSIVEMTRSDGGEMKLRPHFVYEASAGAHRGAAEVMSPHP
jgi:pilus assembly protein CpaF